MRFIIRDDDLNYFTDPMVIDRWYGDILKQQIPVSFATIPFVLPIHERLSHGHPHDKNKNYAVSDNAELTAYVTTNPNIEIMQHGCYHETLNGSFEYDSGLSEIELLDRTKKGKQELEHAFGKPVTIFVPPHDRISNKGIRAIEALGMNIVRGKGTRNIFPSISAVIGMLKMLRHVVRFQHLSPSARPAYPHALQINNHRELFSCRIEMNLSDLLYALEYSVSVNGIFIIAMHINDFDNERKQKLLTLIETARGHGASFTSSAALLQEL